MELFIQIRDGQPHEHPILGDNFRQAFPDIDTNNLPSEFARFIRVECPNNAGVYEVDEVRYEWDGNVVKDVWFVRPMTQEEIVEKDAKEQANLIRSVEFLKEFAQGKADAATNQDAKQAWLDYLAELNLWVYVDWKTPNLPRMPKFDADGNLLPLSAPGSAPSVTG